MAKPPESNWRISHGEDSADEDDEPWRSDIGYSEIPPIPGLRGGRTSASGKIPWGILAIAILSGVALGLFLR